ncbi:unnamed protein product [Mytilus coruscus]|uniref:PML C-terminal domain-containing protein n=1 Tax=Mytilus coruscus TaxID=42192 RepID=A0A6J8CAH6_MYTCO|nr:unnamed protein product [Mytilus coruscus]
MPRLMNTLQQYQLAASFAEKVSGFIDTLPLFRTKFPDLKSHKQEQLAQTILKSTYNAHNASDDVKILQKLVNASDASHEEVMVHSFCTESCIELCKHSKLSTIRYNSLKQLLQEKIVSSVLLKRIADSGLDFNQLCLAYTRDPEKGIQCVLSEKRHDGQVRVTAHKCTAKKIRDFIANTIDRN